MSDFIQGILKDKRYDNHTIHDLKIIRANMIKYGVKDYELAVVQYKILEKEGRLKDIGLGC